MSHAIMEGGVVDMTNIMERYLKRIFECEKLEREEKEFDKLMKRCSKNVLKYQREDDIDLTEEQKREIDSFWEPYKFAVSPDYNTVKIYMNRSGKFDPRYIPDGFRRCFLNQYWWSKGYSIAFQNKAYLAKIYQNVKQPVIVIRKIAGFYYDEQYQMISLDEALDVCEERMQKTEIVIKPSGMNGGRGVVFLEHATREKLKEEFKKIPRLMVVQEAVKQHPFMKKLNPSTVNTVRLTTLLLDNGEVIPLAALVKVGNASVRVDNYKHGGHLVGVGFDGRMFPYALNIEHERVTMLPTGVDLSEGLEVPGFNDVIETAKRAHIQTPQIKMISWDVAIDESAEAVIIEANYAGDIKMHQAVTGPIFGDMTKEILDQYVLKRFYRLRGNMDFDFKEFFDHIELVKYVGGGIYGMCVTVPPRINDKPVTVIGIGCFAGCRDITQVILPDTVKSIRSRAFADCTDLTLVTIPKGLLNLAKDCFAQCGKLGNKEEWDKISGVRT